MRGALGVDHGLPVVGAIAQIEVRLGEDIDLVEGAMSNIYRRHAGLGRCAGRQDYQSGQGKERQRGSRHQRQFHLAHGSFAFSQCRQGEHRQDGGRKFGEFSFHCLFLGSFIYGCVIYSRAGTRAHSSFANCSGMQGSFEKNEKNSMAAENSLKESPVG